MQIMLEDEETLRQPLFAEKRLSIGAGQGAKEPQSCSTRKRPVEASFRPASGPCLLRELRTEAQRERRNMGDGAYPPSIRRSISTPAISFGDRAFGVPGQAGHISSTRKKRI